MGKEGGFAGCRLPAPMILVPPGDGLFGLDYFCSERIQFVIYHKPATLQPTYTAVRSSGTFVICR